MRKEPDVSRANPQDAEQTTNKWQPTILKENPGLRLGLRQIWLDIDRQKKSTSLSQYNSSSISARFKLELFHTEPTISESIHNQDHNQLIEVTNSFLRAIDQLLIELEHQHEKKIGHIEKLYQEFDNLTGKEAKEDRYDKQLEIDIAERDIREKILPLKKTLNVSIINTLILLCQLTKPHNKNHKQQETCDDTSPSYVTNR